ncbi:energy transducer TonB [Neoroseomonas lacus]|uniref:TonB C-terminal domain-containing protein n=1 Tax=Neoroseomonas lacus TaxID=287609 RepID=A0A917KU87_9PROT|nr:energy transducer TonB [Neoroseomonas lacus]GGJ26735.1 hypothetical protein GCM10011320_37730 [Neoroseomonas lacus]
MSGAAFPPSRLCSPPAFLAGGPWRRATAASLALHAAIAAWLVMDWRGLPETGGGTPDAALVVEWAPSQGEPDGAGEPTAEAAAAPAPDLTAAAAPAPPAPPLVPDVPPPPVVPMPMPAPAPPVVAPEPPQAAPPDPSALAEAEPVAAVPPPAPVMEQTEQAERAEPLPAPPPAPPPPSQQVASATPVAQPAPSAPAPRPAPNASAAQRPRRGTPDAAHQVAARGPSMAPAAGAAVAPPDNAGGGPIVIHAPRYRRPPNPPQYPARALDLGMTGTVTVRALVSPDGDTQETRLWRSSGYPLLDAAAIAAVRRWAFEPARHGDRAVPAWVEVPVHFRLN